jgi:hypothetical protein
MPLEERMIMNETPALTLDEIKFLMVLVANEKDNYSEQYFKRFNTSSDVLIYKLQEMACDTYDTPEEM